MLVCDQIEFDRGGFSLRADITLKAGAQVALMGPSGAGKSTFFDLLLGFETPKSGRILWDGRDITRRPPAQRPFAVMFQDHNLFSHLSLRKNLRLARRGVSDDEITKTLEPLGLLPYLETRPTALSGGQVARAGLARALLQERPILALDEPFAALDQGLRHEMLTLVQTHAAAQGRSVMMITHAFEDAQQMKDGILEITDGCLNWRK